MMNPVEMVTAAIANNPLPVILSDPSLTLGPDLTIEEKPVVFQEGDSMQVCAVENFKKIDHAISLSLLSLPKLRSRRNRLSARRDS